MEASDNKLGVAQRTMELKDKSMDYMGNRYCHVKNSLSVVMKL